MTGIRPATRSGWKRWMIFNSVGAMGIVVQMLVLFALTHWAHFNYLLATALSVESAVLHNFVWHQRWTWADRIGSQESFLKTLLGFHVANGALSLAGNLILMELFVGKLGLNFMVANGIAIAVCSIANFVAGDRVVFRSNKSPKPVKKAFKGGRKRPHVKAPSTQTKGCASLGETPALRTEGPKQGGHMKTPVLIGIRFLLLPFFLMLANSAARAADLRPETVRAWNAGIEKIEHRISSELSSNQGFLALDFQAAGTAAQERKRLLSGEIPVDQMGGAANIMQVPDGMIHHWRGRVFIPGVSLDFVLARVTNPKLEDTKQEDVLDSKVLEKQPGQFRLFLKLQRSRIVTVAYNTEHLVKYQRHGPTQASSSSVATRIAEIEFHNGVETEKPEGHDHGYLWRMNSYWRYQEVKGGVIAECESMTLSRSIPNLLEYMIRPIIKSIARESMKRTLESLRTRMVRARSNCGVQIADCGLRNY